MSFNNLAVPSPIAVCASCPQAWFNPGRFEAYGFSVQSGSSKASISARSNTVLPSPLPPLMIAKVPVSPTFSNGTPNEVSSF